MVDASAMAALLFGESSGAEVARRLGGAVLLAPTLMRYELASVCHKKAVQQPSKRKSLLKALELLDEMDVREVGVTHDETIGLAAQSGLTTYDASYLWLAMSLSADLITLDGKLRRAARKLGPKGG